MAFASFAPAGLPDREGWIRVNPTAVVSLADGRYVGASALSTEVRLASGAGLMVEGTLDEVMGKLFEAQGRSA